MNRQVDRQTNILADETIDRQMSGRTKGKKMKTKTFQHLKLFLLKKRRGVRIVKYSPMYG